MTYGLILDISSFILLLDSSKLLFFFYCHWQESKTENVALVNGLWRIANYGRARTKVKDCEQLGKMYVLDEKLRQNWHVRFGPRK